MTGPDREQDAEKLAQRFHETYERLAPSFGYETRRESAVPWDQVPERNRRLMIAVCAELLARDRQDGIVVPRELLERIERRLPYARAAAERRGASDDVLDAMDADQDAVHALLANDNKETTADEPR